MHALHIQGAGEYALFTRGGDCWGFGWAVDSPPASFGARATLSSELNSVFWKGSKYQTVRWVSCEALKRMKQDWW